MEEKYYGLGPGRLYIAPWNVSEEEARTLKWYAGPTKGGVTMTHGARIHEITGWDGALIRQIRYGDRITLTGRLARLYPRVLAAATGSPTDGTTVYIGGRGAAGRHARVRVILVCELPSEEGGEVVFSMRASAASGAAMLLSPERDSSWSFTLTAETDGAGFAGKAVFS